VVVLPLFQSENGCLWLYINSSASGIRQVGSGAIRKSSCFEVKTIFNNFPWRKGSGDSSENIGKCVKLGVLWVLAHFVAKFIYHHSAAQVFHRGKLCSSSTWFYLKFSPPNLSFESGWQFPHKQHAWCTCSVAQQQAKCRPCCVPKEFSTCHIQNCLQFDIAVNEV
jgi:hypothetical protein